MTKVIIEYDSVFPSHIEGRLRRSFDNPYTARSFWIKMDKQSRNPTVINPDKEKKDEDVSGGVDGRKRNKA